MTPRRGTPRGYWPGLRDITGLSDQMFREYGRRGQPGGLQGGAVLAETYGRYGMQRLNELFQRWGIDPGDIAGTSLVGEIPIKEALINRLIARRLAGHPHIASVHVTLLEADEALVRVEPRTRLMPTISVALRIEQQPDLARDALLRLRWSLPASGLLTLVARAIVGYIKTMPPGVQIDRDVIVVDVRTLLRARGLEDVLGLLHRVAFHTRPGALLVQLQAGLG